MIGINLQSYKNRVKFTGVTVPYIRIRVICLSIKGAGMFIVKGYLKFVAKLS